MILRTILLLLLLACGSVCHSVTLLGEQMIELECQGLQERYVNASPDSIKSQYQTEITKLARLYDGNEPQPLRSFFFRFCSALEDRYSSARRADLLSRDLWQSSLDCSTLSTMFLDAVFFATGKLLDFSATRHHVFLSDGELDYDPMRVETRNVAERDEYTQNHVEPRSLTCRTIALAYWRAAQDEGDTRSMEDCLVKAQSWFESGISYADYDFSLGYDYAGFLIETGQRELALSIVEQVGNDYPFPDIQLMNALFFRENGWPSRAAEVITHLLKQENVPEKIKEDSKVLLREITNAPKEK